MLDKIKLPQLPFLTREMMSWGSKSGLDIEVIVLSHYSTGLLLTGATKSAPFSYAINPTGSGARETFNFGIDEFPVGVSLSANAAGVLPGYMYVIAFIRANKTRLFQLFSGYVDQNKALTWPGVQTEKTFPENSLLTNYLSSLPAAGAEVAMQLGNGYLMKVVSVYLKLTTDATVANRRPHVQFSDLFGTVIAEAFPLVDQPASSTYEYWFTNNPNIPDELDNNKVVCSIPGNIILPTQGQINTVTTNLQAGDDYVIAYGWGYRYLWRAS